MNPLLDDLIKVNCRAIKRVVVSAENRRREDARLPLLDSDVMVWLPSGHVAELRLLNWRVWMKRYGVSREYIFDVAVKCYGKARRWSRNPNELLFGFSAQMVTGAAMRERLEEQIAKDFPNDEHRKIAQLKQARPLLETYSSMQQMVDKYGAEMRKRRRAFSTPVREEPRERNFRKT